LDAAPATKIAIHRLLAEFYRGHCPAEDSEPALPARHPLAEEYAILPPYLGEFGFEVRFFLGAVEPWLRNGWMIPARRPELYPPGAAFADAEFFGHIDRLKQRFGCTEVLFNLSFGGTSPRPWRDVTAATRDGSPAVVIDAPDEAFYRRVAIVERSIRRCVKSRYFHPHRSQTVWDYPLTAMHVPWAPSLAFPMNSLVPTYKPAGFSVDFPSIAPHVGVQLRSVALKPERNSDSGRILPLVRAAATHLGLPIVCYGHPEGTLAIPGIPSTHKLAGSMPLLEFELGALAKCRLLFAPETGIANLAGWLQVPTLLEGQQLGYEYESLRPFNPRIDVIDFATGIESQADRLLADEVRVPNPANASNPESFLHPLVGLPALFRDDFDQ
jgi:hypothetical protein